MDTLKDRIGYTFYKLLASSKLEPVAEYPPTSLY